MSKPSLIIDIRSDSVGGALVEQKFDQEKRAVCSNFLKTSRREINFQTQLNLERFFSDLVEALKQVLSELITDHARPGSLTCFLSAPFYVSQTRVITQTWPEPVTITKHLIADLVEADVRQFESVTPSLYREILNDSHELIERKIMQIKLNRYETTTPLDKTASEIVISHYLSIGSERVLNRFRELFQTYLPHLRPVFHSFPFAFYIITRDSSRIGLSNELPSENLLLLDLGGEVAEISLVANGILWDTLSFPFGRNFLIRHLADDLRTVPEAALSALKIYRRGDANQLANDQTATALTRAGVEWLGHFKTALATLIETHLGTNTLLAVGDPIATPIFLNWIKGESYKDLLVSEKGINSSLLTPQSFRNECSQELRNFGNDLYLLLEIIFCDKLKALNQ